MSNLLQFLGENIQMIYILILSVFVGVEVIGDRKSTRLNSSHT